MKTFFLLITLTQNGAGDINASFVNTETLAKCEQKSSMLESVFIAADIPVLVNRCMKSELQFSEFGHASVASESRYFYLITADDKTLKVSVQPDWLTCKEKQKQQAQVMPQTVDQGNVYCSSSIQSML